MEGASIGFLIGAIVCLMAFLVGNISSYKSEESNDKGWDADTFLLDEDSIKPLECKQSDRPVTAEEMNVVIEYFRLGATRYEKRVLDAIQERIGTDEEG